MNGLLRLAGGRSVASSPLDKLPSVEFQAMNSIKHPETYLIRDHKASNNLGRQAVGAERAASRSLTPWTYVDQDPRARSNINAQSPSYFSDGVKINMMGSQYENGLFSSSLSELFGRKCKSHIPIITFVILLFHLMALFYKLQHKWAYGVPLTGLMFRNGFCLTGFL